MTFNQFILQKTENRRLLIISAIIIIIQFAVFKYFYPYPNFIPVESNSYIEAAANNQFINWWPIGYSIFLRLISCFTSSHWVLVTIQYFILQLALLYLLFTVNYLMPLGKWLFRVVVGISIANPLSVLISNCVSSDALFTALSMVWISQLIWIIFQPGRNLMLWHSVIVLLLIMFLFNGLYYPLISLLAIWFTRLPRKEKKIGMAGIIMLLFIYIGRTQYEYQQQTGTVQIAMAPGWQLAANALHAYAQTTPILPEHMRGRFRELHTIVNHHLDSLNQFRHPIVEQDRYYFWNAKSPLVEYMNKHFLHDSTVNYFARQAKTATALYDYGWHLITTAPGSFLQYYIWPNMIKYFVPPSGSIGWSNHDDKIATSAIAKWFRWKDYKPFTRYENNKIEIAEHLPVIIIVINLVFVFSGLAFLILTGFKRTTLFSNGIIWWMAFIWFTNFLFSVWVSPIELRYQLFPMLMTGIFDGLLISWIIQWGRAMSTVNGKSVSFLPRPMM